MFNTVRFQEVSLRHRQQTTRAYHDTQNPGVYYTSCDSGNIYRVIMKEVITTNYITGTTITEVEKKLYCVNPIKKGDRIKLFKENERLERIQHVASFHNKMKNNKKLIKPTIENIEGKQVIITVPYIKTCI